MSNDNHGIIYRLATLDDTDQLTKLRILMQQEVNSVDDQNIPAEYPDKVKKYFVESIQQKKYYSVVALHKEKIICTVGVCLYEKPPSICGGTGLVGYVTNVYTKKAYRKRGIASIAMKQLSELAKDLKVDKLHLGATQDGSNVYRGVGYHEPRFVNLEIKFNY